MKSKLLCFATLFLSCAAVVPAADVTSVAVLGSGQMSTGTVGRMVSLVNDYQVRRCPVNTLASGVIINYDPGDNVIGVRIICRSYAQIGATNTNAQDLTTRIGKASTGTATIECTSGKGVTGLRGRTNLPGYLVALSISCGTVRPRFGTVVNYSSDETFGNGRGALVERGSVALAESPVGGSGVSVNKDCVESTPFLIGLDASISPFGVIDGVGGICGKTVTKLLATNPARPDLAVRTIGQQRRMTVTGDLDIFTLEVFSLGSGISNGNLLYADLIFNTSDVQFIAVPGGCASVSSGRFRCQIASAADFRLGATAGFEFTMDARRAHGDTPLVVAQATYEVDDTDYSNNTYGFATKVVE